MFSLAQFVENVLYKKLLNKPNSCGHSTLPSEYN